MTRTRRTVTLVSAALLLLLGAALLAGGAYLVSLGGSPYYAIAGAALLLSGLLYARGLAWGERVFAAVLIGTLAWAALESGANPWGMLARTFALAVAGFWLATPWVRRGLRGAGAGLRRNPPALAAIVILAVLVTLFTRYQAGVDVAVAASGPAAAGRVAAPPDPPDTDWTSYANDLSGQRFGALSQIDARNVGQLQIAWIHRSGELGMRKPVVAAGAHAETVSPGFRAEATPIKVGDIIYTCGTYADVYAIDAKSGKERWRSTTGVDTSGYLFFTCRGLSYYRQPGATGPCAARVISAGPGGVLRALDALTGAPCQDFGDHGRVSLLTDMGHVDPVRYKTTSPPAIVGGLAIVGSMISDNRDADMPSGVIKAFDVKTGALRWAWDMGVPDRIGAPAPGAIYTRSTPNSWAVFSADEKLGLVYVPTGNASPDFYGLRRRPFDEKYSSSLVALNIKDGRPRWSFQTTRHDLWDYDLSAQPVLVTLAGPRGNVPAVLQATKRGDIFVLDRRDGRPIVPVREVPASSAGAIGGERVSASQPVSRLSLIPPPLTEASMWGATPIDQMLCRIAFRQARYDGIFTPPGLRTAIQQPGQVGTIDWGGVSLDGERGILIANISDIPWLTRQVPRRQVPDADHTAWPQMHTPYVGVADPFFGPLRMPCNQPPWGKLVAIDLATRTVLWSRVVGTARDNGPFGVASGLPLLVGQPSFGGTIVTRGGVVFMAATLDRYLRAFDTATGAMRWQARLPAGAQASPMTYMAGGRQYVVITAGGHAGAGTKAGDFTIAFALPRSA